MAKLSISWQKYVWLKANAVLSEIWDTSSSAVHNVHNNIVDLTSLCSHILSFIHNQDIKFWWLHIDVLEVCKEILFGCNTPRCCWTVYFTAAPPGGDPRLEWVGAALRAGFVMNGHASFTAVSCSPGVSSGSAIKSSQLPSRSMFTPFCMKM